MAYEFKFPDIGEGISRGRDPGLEGQGGRHGRRGPDLGRSGDRQGRGGASLSARRSSDRPAGGRGRHHQRGRRCSDDRGGWCGGRAAGGAGGRGRAAMEVPVAAPAAPAPPAVPAARACGRAQGGAGRPSGALYRLRGGDPGGGTRGSAAACTGCAAGGRGAERGPGGAGPGSPCPALGPCTGQGVGRRSQHHPRHRCRRKDPQAGRAGCRAVGRLWGWNTESLPAPQPARRKQRRPGGGPRLWAGSRRGPPPFPSWRELSRRAIWASWSGSPSEVSAGRWPSAWPNPPPSRPR